MKIALGQIRIKSNNPKHNFERMLEAIEDARNQNVDCIIFPELSLSGVVNQRNLSQAFIDEVMMYNQKVVDLSHNIDIIFGSYDYDKTLYNASYYASKGKLVDKGYKSKLNEQFYEHRFFTPKEKDFNIMIDDEEYTVTLDTPGENTIYLHTNLYMHDKKHDIYKNSMMVSGVGIINTGNEVYGLSGGSYFDYQGFLAECNHVYEDEILVQDTSQIVEYLNVPTDEILPFILPIIEMFDEEHLSFKPKWIVGVSGGLDSSVSFALLSLALGSDRVHGVTMPGAFTRDLTLSNAHHLAKKLETSFEEIPIHLMVDATLNSLEKYQPITGLSHENIQARLRGHTLMSVASLINGVVCNNGNKIETALGYATIYGDAIGALSILGDLTKIEVGKLAQEINEAYEDEVIPKNIIPELTDSSVNWDFAPSAELAKDQFDPFKWGYHDALIVYLLSHSPEEVLEMYLDGSIKDTEFGKFMNQYQMHDAHKFIEDLEWLIRTLNGAIFKRLQTPPILRVSKQGFGFENQSTIYQTERYQALKDAILKKNPN